MRRVGSVLAMLIVLLSAATYNVLVRTRQASQAPLRPTTREVRPLRADTVTPSSSSRTLAGIIRADQEAAVSPKTPGRITRIVVYEGERIRAGDLLAKLDIAEMTAQVDAAREGARAADAALDKAVAGRSARRAEMDSALAEAEAGLRVAEARLKQAAIGVPLTTDTAASDRGRAEAAVRQAEAGLRQAEAALALAEDSARRLKELEKHGGVAPIEVESAVRQAEMARAARDAAVSALSLAEAALRPTVTAQTLRAQVAGQDVDAARAGRDLAVKTRLAASEGRRAALRVADSDVRAARAFARQAQAQVVSAQSTVGNGLIRSPISGVVTKLTAREGEFAQPGIPMMRIVGSGTLHAVVAVSARDSGRIRIGQRVSIVSYSDKSVRCEATVARVAPVVSADGRTVEISLRSPSLSTQFRPGEAVRVSLRLSAESSSPTSQP